MGDFAPPKPSGLKGKKRPSNAEARSQQLFDESTGLRQETIRQTEEALRTGGVGARIPSIQRSVEASNQATSRSLRGLESDIARTPGLAGTPFGRRIQTQTQLAGDQRTSQIPTQIANQIAGDAGNLSLGFPKIAIGGLGQAESTKQSGKNADTQASAAIAAAAIAAFACWVAFELWGAESLIARDARRYVRSTDNWFLRLYRKHGLHWAQWLRTHSWARFVFLPIWGVMAMRGRRLK